MAKIKELWGLLGKTIYVGERKEKNLKICEWIGIVVAIIGGIMTAINHFNQSGFVTYTTAAFCCTGIVIYVTIKKYRKRFFAVITVLLVCTFSFTYYAITGVNEGFAILWTLLIPIAYCYFIDVKSGLILLMYYELLFVVLFYTPIRNMLDGLYTKEFMNRFPVLYLCAFLINASAMIQYHLTMLNQIGTEEKLKETAEAARTAANAKSSFLAQMSHEIRTPINTVLGMNEMILRKATDSEILDYASDIRNSGNTLLSLINSILDFSKIEEGKMELIPAEYKLADVIDTLLKSTEDRAKAKELVFNTDIDPKLPSILFGDDVRLTQIISNLLTNAIKYTDVGHVDFKIKCNWKNNNSVLLLVTVSDTGIGIKEDDLKKLFNSFERLDITRNRNIEGTGLGMSIVNKLLDMMNSRLSVESEYGKGSTFSFKVYQKIIDPTPIGDYRVHIRKKAIVPHVEERIYAPEARILVVDDNPMNLKVAAHLLRLYGINTELADSGYRSLELMKKKTYDIIFMDHMMPKMDGIKTLEIAKSDKLMPPETKIIALTANAINGARELYLSAGFDAYLSKPIDTNELTEMLRKYLPKSLLQKPVEEESDPTPEAIIPRKIYSKKSSAHVIPQGRNANTAKASKTIVSQSVNEKQKNIHTANTQSNSDNEVLEFAPAGESSSNISVNAHNLADDEILEFAPAGEASISGSVNDQNIADDEILEFAPVDEANSNVNKNSQNEMNNEILEFSPDLEPEESTENAENYADSEDEIMEFSPTDEASEYEETDDIEEECFIFDLNTLKNLGIDTDAALGYCAYDENLYNELLNDFVYESESRQTELDEFCNDNNMKDYKIKIHAMKSLSRTLGFNDLSELALELEHAAGDSDVEYVSERHRDFVQMYSASVTALRNLMH